MTRTTNMTKIQILLEYEQFNYDTCFKLRAFSSNLLHETAEENQLRVWNCSQRMIYIL